MKLTEQILKELIIKIINDKQINTYWATASGVKVNIEELSDYLGDKTIDVDPVEVKDQVLKSRGKERLPVGPGITSQERIDNADLSFPIIATMKGGKYTQVLDGNHRLQKAVDHKNPLKAKILDLDDPDIPKKYKELFS